MAPITSRRPDTANDGGPCSYARRIAWTPVTWEGVIGLATAVIALVTALIGLVKVSDVGDILKAREQGCPVAIRIDEPTPGDHVSSDVNVTGSSTVHTGCKFIYVMVRGQPSSIPFWKVSDVVLLDKKGLWAARVSLKHIPLGENAYINVRVSDEPSVYRIGQRLKYPPVEGTESNVVRVRRVNL
jgi:hypothetical protein